METRKSKARQAFEGRWLRETEKELYECVEKSHQTRDPHFRANLEAHVDVLCNKLKLHHQSLGTYNTAEALEERRRVGVDLGILRQQDQHLVSCVHEPLPTRSELEGEEVSTETAQSDDESMFLTPLPATEVVPASVPTFFRYFFIYKSTYPCYQKEHIFRNKSSQIAHKELSCSARNSERGTNGSTLTLKDHFVPLLLLFLIKNTFPCSQKEHIFRNNSSQTIY